MTPRSASACLVLLTLFSVTPASGQDPWSRVPAFSKACYTKGDPFGDQVQRALEETQAAIEAQKETNLAARAALDEVDAMTKQTRMNAYMQKNPAVAAQKMQLIAGSGAELQAALSEKQKASAAIEEKWKAVQAQSRKDEEAWIGLRDQALAAFDPGSRNRAQGPGLLAQSNEAYKAYCQKWFVEPTSPFLGYLAEYKTYLVEKEVVADELAFQGQLVHFEMFGVPLNGFKSTASLEATAQYLKKVDEIFRSRQEEPRTSP